MPSQQLLQANLMSSHSLSKNSLIGSTTLSLNQSEATFQASTIESQHLIATALTVSQFFTSNTTVAITAAIAAIAKPIGEVKNAIAAPKAPVTVAPIVAVVFHRAVAAVIAPCATVEAIIANLFATN